MIKASHLLSLLFAVLAFVSEVAFAQNAKLYLNKQEIALPSVNFLDAATIDSINFYTGAEANQKLNLPTIGVDSVFVIFKKDMSDVVTYYQMLTLYHLDERARKLPLNLGSAKYKYVERASLMMFNLNKMPSVSVETAYNSQLDYISILSLYKRPYNSAAGKTLTWLQGYVEGIGDNFYYKKFKKQ